MKLASSGKLVWMMSKSSARETELNMLVKSTNTAACVGVLLFCCGCVMNLSIESCMDLMMKSIPLGKPTAKLYGRRWWANLSFQVVAMCVAIILQMAEGIPIGPSVGSLCRQKRYVSVKSVVWRLVFFLGIWL